MKKSILTAALLGAVAVPAMADISLQFDGRTLGSPSNWSYSVWGSWGDLWFPGDSPTVILYDIPGYLAGSASFSAFSSSGSQAWTLDEDPTIGGDLGLVDLRLTFTDAGPGDAAPLSDTENGIGDEVHFYGDLTFQSLYSLTQPGVYDAFAGSSEWLNGQTTVPYFRAPVTEIPEASTVLSMGALVGLGAGAWLKRRKTVAAK